MKSTNIGKKKNLEINQQWHLKNDDRISCNAKVADNRERERETNKHIHTQAHTQHGISKDKDVQCRIDVILYY